MPTYTYQCKSCHHTFDLFHGISAQPSVKCPKCKRSCKRLLGAGAGVIFKGSGFYETDYKKASAGGGKAAPKTETKKETKSESKPEGKTTTNSKD